MARFRGTAGPDRFIGKVGSADDFRFSIADLSPRDTIVGGGGTAIDRLVLTTSGIVTASMLNGLSGVEAISLVSAKIWIAVDDAVVESNGRAGARLNIFGSRGADVIDASQLNEDHAVAYLARSGNDRFVGGAGRDTVVAAGKLDSHDLLIGGAGIDLLRFATSGAVTSRELSDISGFERFALIARFNQFEGI